MDKQEIFNGLLGEFRSSHLIDSDYQLRENEVAKHDASTLSRLLAMGELLLDMRSAFNEIKIRVTEEQGIIDTVDTLRKKIFSEQELNILGAR